MTERENLRIAHQALAALNAHDIDSYLNFLDDSVVGESGTAGTYQGREGARKI